MPKHPKTGQKRPADLNQLAGMIVGLSTKDKPMGLDVPAKSSAVKGRAGGLKGGEARASQLTPAKRKEIAKKGAEARWKKS